MFVEFDIAFTNKAHIIISHFPQVIARTGKWQGVVLPVRRGGGGKPLKIWNYLEAVQNSGCWE